MNVQAYRRVLYRRFYSYWFSYASVVNLIFRVAEVVLPFVFCFFLQVVWTREAIYTEQPNVLITSKYIVDFQNQAGDTLFDSSISSSSLQLSDMVQYSQIDEVPLDYNRNGRTDKLKLTVKSCFDNPEYISSARLMYFPRVEIYV
ncbi:MAG: hypothetical protein EZS28_032832 [Streblomastix strix]|uniref:Transmembrane protein 231 n=1 Tax=Streblomastix strix TaxID=222440 RepID=A0A5J4UNT3_9EUKA|nr:MAG: hypothetical protein EZS28_032832 [Streblomastix strix]